jgi:hypothetical protein
MAPSLILSSPFANKSAFVIGATIAIGLVAFLALSMPFALAQTSPAGAVNAQADNLHQFLFSSMPVLVGVLATGVLGYGFAYWWNLKLKRREADLAMLKGFHDLYGEFFAVWKLWNYYVRDIGPDDFPDASRWKLLERASAAEGSTEAILIGLASQHRFSPASLEALGQFRQVYQRLRESIRDNQALKWDTSEHPEYMAFKRLSPVIAYMIRTGRNVDGLILNQQTKAWLEVTHNKHERFWKT